MSGSFGRCVFKESSVNVQTTVNDRQAHLCPQVREAFVSLQALSYRAFLPFAKEEIVAWGDENTSTKELQAC